MPSCCCFSHVNPPKRGSCKAAKDTETFFFLKWVWVKVKGYGPQLFWTFGPTAKWRATDFPTGELEPAGLAGKAWGPVADVCTSAAFFLKSDLTRFPLDMNRAMNFNSSVLQWHQFFGAFCLDVRT